MSVRLSEKLMDAYMSGDTQEIEIIKDELRQREVQLRSKKQSKSIQISTVFSDDKAPAVEVYDFLNKIFGNDWWEWETETIEHLLWINYGVALEDINRDKVQAIRHVCRSDRCFFDWFEFNQIALAFSGVLADFEYLRKPSSGMIINAVKSINYIRPDRECFFSDDVLNYICIALKDDGIYIPPPSLFLIIKDKMANMISDEIKSKWSIILKRYNDFVTNESEVINESDVDIQAKRLVVAEAAGLSY